MTALLIGSGFVLGTVAITWSVYFGMRLLAAHRVVADSRDLAASVIFRVAALHGLIIALVFAQEMRAYERLRSILVDEATAIADIYYDMRRFGGAQEHDVQAALSRYAHEVAEVEWVLMATSGTLSPEAWELRETVYLALLDLSPETSRDDALREHMLEDVQRIAAVRQLRESMAEGPVNVLFWVAALGGVALVSLPYFVFRPSAVNLMLLSVYGGFTGLVMFLIYALSDPFSPPGLLEPVAIQRLLQTEIGAGPASD